MYSFNGFCKERAAVLQGELSRTLEATANAEKFMKVIRKHTSFEELTPTLLREFVEKIVVHESEALDGKRRGKLRRQEIEIYYCSGGDARAAGGQEELRHCAGKAQIPPASGTVRGSEPVCRTSQMW